MREGRFRAKHPETGTWMYFGIKNVPFWVQEEKFQQYTGLEDKDGIPIFEGDIVKGVDFKLHVEYFAQVSWHPNGYWYVFNKNGKGIDFLNRVELVEVVGNIIDNRELLEVKE